MTALHKLNGEDGSSSLKIFTEDSKLKIKIGVKTQELKYVDDNTFLDDRIILKFDASSNPAVIHCFFPWGIECELPRVAEVKEELTSTKDITQALSILGAELIDAPKNDNDIKESIFVSSSINDNPVNNEEIERDTYEQDSHAVIQGVGKKHK